MNTCGTNIPKQALALVNPSVKVSTYESTGGMVTSQFIAHNLKLISSIAPGAVIHDNAAGSGTASRVVLAQQPDVNIYATDSDEPCLQALRKDVNAHGWPVYVSNQRCEALNFADSMFDLSITNIAIFFTGNAGLDGAREIYRTLKPGGTAIANCWRDITWLIPVLETHKRFRTEHPWPAPRVSWSNGQQLQKIFTEVGFEESKMKVSSSEASAQVPDRELWAWAEKLWAYLAGIPGWFPEDEAEWSK